MTVVANLSVRSNDCTLASALSLPDGAPVRVTQVIEEGATIVPYFWVTVQDPARFEEQVLADERVRRLTAIDRRADKTLYRLEWRPEGDREDGNEELLSALLAADVVIESATGTDGVWTFRLWAPDYRALSTVRETAVGPDGDVSVRQLYTVPSGREADATGLTDKQEEALVLAYERGYFEVPRETAMSDIADELGISDTAAAQRISRGLSTLVADVVLGTQPGPGSG